MGAKNSVLVFQSNNKKQEALNNLAAAAKKERFAQRYHKSGYYHYSMVIQELAKHCKNYGYSSIEIAEAANVTPRCINRWLNNALIPTIRELTIVPNQPVDIFPPLLSNKNANTISNISEQCELIFPSGVKLIMDANFFSKNITELLFKPQDYNNA